MKEGEDNSGFIGALIDCGMIQSDDKRIYKLRSINRIDMLIDLSKLGIDIWNTVELLYVLREYSKNEQDKFIRKLEKTLQDCKRYLVNYDVNRLIKEITNEIKHEKGSVRALDSVMDITRISKSINYIIKINGEYFRIEKENQDMLLINEANDKIYLRANKNKLESLKSLEGLVGGN